MAVKTGFIGVVLDWQISRPETDPWHVLSRIIISFMYYTTVREQSNFLAAIVLPRILLTLGDQIPRKFTYHNSISERSNLL